MPFEGWRPVAGCRCDPEEGPITGLSGTLPVAGPASDCPAGTVSHRTEGEKTG